MKTQRHREHRVFSLRALCASVFLLPGRFPHFPTGFASTPHPCVLDHWRRESPRHQSSTESPPARYSRMVSTAQRKPRRQGLPWQIKKVLCPRQPFRSGTGSFCGVCGAKCACPPPRKFGYQSRGLLRSKARCRHRCGASSIRSSTCRYPSPRRMARRRMSWQRIFSVSQPAICHTRRLVTIT